MTFPEITEAMIEAWHGIVPPNDPARRMALLGLFQKIHQFVGRGVFDGKAFTQRRGVRAREPEDIGSFGGRLIVGHIVLVDVSCDGMCDERAMRCRRPAGIKVPPMGRRAARPMLAPTKTARFHGESRR